ncbi:MAG: ATP-dependent helicase [Acidimicrobiales bacterium]
MFVLNDVQQAAVDHEGSPLLVVAGAGSGKTAMLASRVARLLRSGVDPSRICLLTFSRRAAAELLARAGRLSDAGAAGRVWGGTFHAVANRVLRAEGLRIGLGPSFSILDASDAGELFGLVRHDLGLSHPAPSSRPGGARGRSRFPGAATLAAIYDRVAGTGQPLGAVVERWFPWCAADLDGIRSTFVAYTARKRERRLLDYDDLLLGWRALGSAAPSAMAALFDHVLVDEYQDTNAVQADILAALRPGGSGLTAVGDDAQAIYGFRAASAANLADFEARFPATTVVRLEQNYRSTPPVLAVANAVMAEAAPGSVLAKRLWSARPGARRPVLRTCGDETAEAEAVCDSVLAHRDDGVALHDQAVLFRAASHADLLELALARRNIPYVKYGGLRFLEAAHVKDLMALLRVLDNPTDELAWFRILRLLEGVGAATARRVMADLGLSPPAAAPSAATPPPAAPMAATPPPADPMATPLGRLLAAAPRVPSSARAELDGLREALGECADAALPGGGTLAPGAQVARLRRWLGPVVERCYDAAPARLTDLDHLEAVAAAAPSRQRVVADLTLDPPSSTSDLAGPPLLDEDWLVLSTVHSAKGGEWDVVHVIHASDGMFPSDMATGDADGVEEERRLLYVAVTRARHSLEVYAPLRYHHGRRPDTDAHSWAQPSRFLTAGVRAGMDECHLEGRTGPEELPPADGVAAGTGMAAVDDLLAGLWA